MATVEQAKQFFVNELKSAGMIHPHSGQEELVLGALDKFLADAAPIPPVAEVEPEPVAEVEPEPVAEVEPEPVDNQAAADVVMIGPLVAETPGAVFPKVIYPLVGITVPPVAVAPAIWVDTVKQKVVFTTEAAKAAAGVTLASAIVTGSPEAAPESEAAVG